MFKKSGFFSGFWKAKNPHSLEHLKYLYSVMSKNQTVTESNKSLLVETLREIAEILIWGDQNDSSVFDFFLERNMLSFFLKIMDQKSGTNYVCVQLLQTLNILFENISNETSIYYLLSNNHVNSIIIHKFDFSDEEVMAYYISFLKTLSFRLNKHTIHFFYNEHTHDFPLYTEAIKFFNHSESMVRIAVRTLSLNVYRVEDMAMLKFVTDKTAAPYFSNLVWFIGSHILDIDACVRNDADHQSLNKLKDLVAEHLDHLHYLNDILCLNIDSLNKVLSDHLLNRLFIPLYMYSLSRDLYQRKPFVSPVVALFLLCQVFLIITHIPLVRLLAWIIVAGDLEVFTERGATLYVSSPSKKKSRQKPSFMAPSEPLDKLLEARIRGNTSDTEEDNEVEHANTGSISELTLLPSPFHVPSPPQTSEMSDLSITDEEKLRLAGERKFSLENRPFLAALFQFLDHSDNDYIQLYALCLIYAMQINSGINKELLASVSIHGVKASNFQDYNQLLMEKYIKLVTASCQYSSRVRLVTLELLIKSIKLMVITENKSIMVDSQFAALEGAREESTLILRNFYKSEEIFLDMFEDEYREMVKRAINVEFVMSDASLLLPPTGTPLTGIEFRKRLPCGEVERARKAIRTFFLLRDISLCLQRLDETCLPLTSPDCCVAESTLLDLNNSDLQAVYVEYKDGERQRRFLVVDNLQIILVKPDQHRLGWGVAKFSGLLQDLEVTSDKDDSRCLHVTVHKPSSGATKGTPVPRLAATFTFDDHIRCMAAKQRLTKGRTKARQKKMQLIAKMLELPAGNTATAGGASGNSSSPWATATLTSLRQESRRNRLSSSGGPGGSNSARSTPSPRSTTNTSRQQFENAMSHHQHHLRVPGCAAPLSKQPRHQQPGRGKRPVQRRPTPGGNGGTSYLDQTAVASSSRDHSPSATMAGAGGGIQMEAMPPRQNRLAVSSSNWAESSAGRSGGAEEETSFEDATWYTRHKVIEDSVEDKGEDELKDTVESTSGHTSGRSTPRSAASALGTLSTPRSAIVTDEFDSSSASSAVTPRTDNGSRKTPPSSSRRKGSIQNV